MSQNNKPSKEDLQLLQKLKEDPKLYSSIQDIISIMDSPENEGKSFDEIEDLIIPKLKELGRNSLGNWVSKQESSASKQLKSKDPTVKQREKKRLVLYCIYGRIEVTERLWRSSKSSYIRVLPQTIGLSDKGCSSA